MSAILAPGSGMRFGFASASTLRLVVPHWSTRPPVSNECVSVLIMPVGHLSISMVSFSCVDHSLKVFLRQGIFAKALVKQHSDSLPNVCRQNSAVLSPIMWLWILRPLGSVPSAMPSSKLEQLRLRPDILLKHFLPLFDKTPLCQPRLSRLRGFRIRNYAKVTLKRTHYVTSFLLLAIPQS